MVAADTPDSKDMRTGSQKPVDVFIDGDQIPAKVPQCLVEGLISMTY